MRERERERWKGEIGRSKRVSHGTIVFSSRKELSKLNGASAFEKSFASCNKKLIDKSKCMYPYKRASQFERRFRATKVEKSFSR